MPDAELSVREFVAVASRAYPCLVLDSDQWHEVGYFFDPIENLYAFYSIDRKDQQDSVERFASVEELLAAYGVDERVASWAASFRLHLEFGERFVYYAESRTLLRLPVAASTTMTADEGLTTLDGPPLGWLREQLA